MSLPLILRFEIFPLFSPFLNSTSLSSLPLSPLISHQQIQLRPIQRISESSARSGSVQHNYKLSFNSLIHLLRHHSLPLPSHVYITIFYITQTQMMIQITTKFTYLHYQNFSCHSFTFGQADGEVAETDGH